MINPYYEKDGIIIYNGDALEILSLMQDTKFDLVLSDPPYGTTNCEWDNVPHLKKMWEILLLRANKTTPFVFTCSQPFTSKLVLSNEDLFKYEWVWHKNKATGHLSSKLKPMKAHESICVFYEKQPTYNPQGLIEKEVPTISKGSRGKKQNGASGDVYRKASKDAVQTHSNYPKSILKFDVDMKAEYHPTQKPVALMEYFINTYTNEGDIILDLFMGSGTTLVAAKKLKRKAVGIDIFQKYCDSAIKRLTLLDQKE